MNGEEEKKTILLEFWTTDKTKESFITYAIAVGAIDQAKPNAV